MTYLSILEKFRILFNTLLDFEFILMFTILLLILTFLYLTKKLSNKKYMLYMALSFTGIFAISIISNYEILANTFDDFSTIFFRNIYFPSIYVYIGVLVTSFIAFIISMLNVMLKRIYKVINSIMFVINNVLFIIVINIIAKNKIDIFSVNSLYTNTSLVAVLELSIGLCILWVLSLTAAYITNCVCDRWSHKTVYNTKESEVTFSPVLEVTSEVEESPVVTTNEVLVEAVSDIEPTEDEIIIETIDETPEDIETNYSPVLELAKEVEELPTTIVIAEPEVKRENKFIIPEVTVSNTNTETKKNEVFESILNGGIPVTYYDNKVVSEEYNIMNPYKLYEKKYNEVKNENVVFNNIDITLENDDINTIKSVSEKPIVELENVNTLSGSYTAEDYRKISKMLNEIKTRSNGTNINIDDAVAISLISNYSIEDCIKFKKILQSNLNLN